MSTILPPSICDSTLDIYADETTWENVSHLVDALNQDLKRLDEWSAQKKMFINTEKTESMLVTGKRLRNFVASSSIDVNLDVRNIEQVTDFKLVDATLDKDLSFNRQDEELSKKF